MWVKSCSKKIRFEGKTVKSDWEWGEGVKWTEGKTDCGENIVCFTPLKTDWVKWTEVKAY